MKKLTTSEFIERATEVHNGKYDYSKVNYVNNSTKVCIICPEHGEFWQTPNGHLLGKGCHICARINGAKNRTYSTKKFIDKARLIHGNKYDYSKTIYKGVRTKVCIICPIHGEFWQVPNYHIDGCGCPECGKDSHHKHLMSNSKIYKVHSGIVQRCTNPNNFKYNCYGGRGIGICKNWLKFELFYKWAIENGYKEGLTIERIDVNGNYEPNNCKWITRREQYYNQRRTNFVYIHGNKISIVELKDRLNIKRGVLEYYYSRYGSDRVVSYLEKNYSNELKTLYKENM